MVAAALLLLLVVCANVATLLLVRGEWRAREFAIRRSLGASIGRVRRQLFIEALEVCLFGGALGLVFAWEITTLLTRLLPPSARALSDVIVWHANARAMLATVVITALCAIASSIWPARRAGHDELTASLASARSRASGGWPVQRILAIGQVSAAMVLIAAAWLLVATASNLTRGAGGYGSRDVIIAQVDVRALRDSIAGSAAALGGCEKTSSGCRG
jgi:predicted lysophospholipase L1 biosynthesis ABC-type transport system permease subunit